MKYKRIYESIENPLDDPAVINRIMEAYADDKWDFYSAVQNIECDDTKYSYRKKEYDKLYVFLFESWKKEILSIPKSTWEKIVINKENLKKIYKTIDFLKGVKKVKTREDVLKIQVRGHEDEDIKEIIKILRWNKIIDTWTHIDSIGLNTTNQTKSVEHRLYINADTQDIHKFTRLFLEKCLAEQLPFYLKIHETDKRNDNIVIYTDTENLPKYIEILKKIKKEHPIMAKRFGIPSLLTGKIDGWIGYGSEPLQQKGKESFNSTRLKIIENVIDEELRKWSFKHINDDVSFKGKKMKLHKCICTKIMEKHIKSLKDYIIRYPKDHKYTPHDLSKKEFIDRLYQDIQSKFPSIYQDYINNKTNSTMIDVKINDKERTEIYFGRFIEMLQKSMIIYAARDPQFIKSVKRRIAEEAKKSGIDPNKYCFDIENVKLLIKAEQECNKNTSNTQTTKVTQSTSSECSEPVGEKKLSSQESINKQNMQKTREKPEEYISQQQTSEKIQHYYRPAGTPYTYKPMTDEEIINSQKKLEETPQAKPKVYSKKQ